MLSQRCIRRGYRNEGQSKLNTGCVDFSYIHNKAGASHTSLEVATRDRADV